MALLKKILLIALPLIVGLAIGLGYGRMQLRTEQGIHQAKVKEFQNRLALAQRKFSEEKAQHNSLEQDNQGIQEELEKLKKEKGVLVSQREELKAKTETLEAKAASSEAKVASLEKKISSVEAKAESLEKKAASLEAKNHQLTEHLAKADADRKALDQRLRQNIQALQEREKELKQLAADWQRLQGDLKRVNQKYDQCAGHNARLYGIAEELIRKYEDKGVVDTLLQKEPITQTKKVDLEKMAQEYKDKIEQQKIRNQDR